MAAPEILSVFFVLFGTALAMPSVFLLQLDTFRYPLLLPKLEIEVVVSVLLDGCKNLQR